MTAATAVPAQKITLGHLTLKFGAIYRVVTTYRGEEFTKTFVGVKRSEYDGTYWLYFVAPGTNGKQEIGYNFSEIAIADEIVA